MCAHIGGKIHFSQNSIFWPLETKRSQFWDIFTPHPSTWHHILHYTSFFTVTAWPLRRRWKEWQDDVSGVGKVFQSLDILVFRGQNIEVWEKLFCCRYQDFIIELFSQTCIYAGVSLWGSSFFIYIQFLDFLETDNKNNNNKNNNPNGSFKEGKIDFYWPHLNWS